ncbi:unnamed protein product, partial [Phaeothamnion confervicola]
MALFVGGSAAVAAATAAGVSTGVVARAARRYSSAPRRAAEDGADADANAVAAAATAAAAKAEDAPALAAWAAATMYWVHPSSALPPAGLSAQHTALEGLAKCPQRAAAAAPPHPQLARGAYNWTSFFWARRRDWEDAFRSLYYGLRVQAARAGRADSDAGGGGGGDGGYGDGDGGGGGVHSGYGGGRDASFYVRGPKLAALFCVLEPAPEGPPAPGGEPAPLVAVVSRSTRQLRRKLRDAGVSFRMPLDPAADGADGREQDEAVLREVEALGKHGGNVAGAGAGAGGG